MSTIVLGGDGREYFRTGTQWQVGLVPSPDGTHLIRAFTSTHRTKFPVVREGSTFEVEWGNNALIGLDGEALKENLSLDYQAEERPVRALLVDEREVLLVIAPNPDTGQWSIALSDLDGKARWTLGSAYLAQGGVLFTGNWADAPVAFVLEWTGDAPNYKVATLAISLRDGAVISRTGKLSPDHIVDAYNRAMVAQFSDGFVLHDVTFKPLCWGRIQHRQQFANLDCSDGVVWGQWAEFADGAQNAKPTSEIFDFRNCNPTAGVGSVDQPIRPIVIEGTWAVAVVAQDELTLVGQNRPEEVVKSVRLDLSK